MTDSNKSLWQTVKPFVNGGASGMLATCCIQPIDMVKVRLQLGAQGGPFAVASQIIKEDGFFSMYKGLVSHRCTPPSTLSCPRCSPPHCLLLAAPTLLSLPRFLVVPCHTSLAPALCPCLGAICPCLGALHYGHRPPAPLLQSAGLLRQATYTTARMGIFNKLSEELKEMNKDTGVVPIWQNAVAGQIAGGLGAVVGNPADLSLIRMQADGVLPPGASLADPRRAVPARDEPPIR